MAFELTSTAFEQGEMIPRTYTCDAEDISPPLAWSDPPERTQSFALICEDPDAPKGTWSHWVLYNIPGDRRSLPEDVMRGAELFLGALQGENDFGDIEYGGPCPPPGKPHRYYFYLYALDDALDLEHGATREELLEAMRGYLLERAELMGRYERQT
jgi:hypothetical protein